jgi:benzoyl-CoA reductase/2-hydroxyglutaryl-CoA dehydratase subunit BcrC/BadD/HgdB
MPEPTSATMRLAWHYENPMAQALEAHRAGIPVVGITSNTIPWELVRAAGCFPLMLRADGRATPAADEYMEANVFHRRIRQIFDSVVSGAWDFLRAILLPRTSEQEYKLFLYSREVARERTREGMPRVYLYDLLHTRSPESREYGLERTYELKKQLEEITGQPIGADALREAVVESNAARAAVRRLLRLRHDGPRLSGTEALRLIGPFWFMSRAEFATLALEAAEDLERRERLPGVRLLVKGAPLDGVGLHSALETRGAVVIAEDDWWGARSVGVDIDASADVLTAIFEHYYLEAPSPRVFPPEDADRWFQSRVTNGVDGVVFYLPPEDYVAGWDYPRQKQFLDGLGIRSLVMREDAEASALSLKAGESIEKFVRAAARKP